MARQAKNDFVLECRAILRGLQTTLAHVATVTLGGVAYSREELIALFQSVLDANGATDTASAAYYAAVARERSVHERVRPLRNLYRTYVQTTFGKASPSLPLVGVKKSVPAKPPVTVKLEAVMKRQATREARRTLGKNAKKKIKGVLPDEKKPKK